MKITKKYLQKITKEEIKKLLNEGKPYIGRLKASSYGAANLGLDRSSAEPAGEDYSPVDRYLAQRSTRMVDELLKRINQEFGKVDQRLTAMEDSIGSLSGERDSTVEVDPSQWPDVATSDPRKDKDIQKEATMKITKKYLQELVEEETGYLLREWPYRETTEKKERKQNIVSLFRRFASKFDGFDGVEVENEAADEMIITLKASKTNEKEAFKLRRRIHQSKFWAFAIKAFSEEKRSKDENKYIRYKLWHSFDAFVLENIEMLQNSIRRGTGFLQNGKIQFHFKWSKKVEMSVEKHEVGKNAIADYDNSMRKPLKKSYPDYQDNSKFLRSKQKRPHD